MGPPDDTGLRGVASGLLRSYAMDLRGWVSRLAAGYAVAVAILVGSVLALFAAIAVGVTALFDFIERRHGAEVAYGSVGGGLLILAVILLLIGWAMLRRRTPPLPRPQRQVQAARRELFGSTALRATGGLPGAETAKAAPTTRLLVAAAATMLVGWIVASRMWSRPRRRRERL
jgi:hypothetical protein